MKNLEESSPESLAEGAEFDSVLQSSVVLVVECSKNLCNFFEVKS